MAGLYGGWMAYYVAVILGGVASIAVKVCSVIAFPANGETKPTT